MTENLDALFYTNYSVIFNIFLLGNIKTLIQTNTDYQIILFDDFSDHNKHWLLHINPTGRLQDVKMRLSLQSTRPVKCIPIHNRSYSNTDKHSPEYQFLFL